MSIYKRVIGKIISKLYPLFEALGFNVVPVNHASPMPETKDLTGALFARESDCVGMDWNLAVQQEYLGQIFPLYAGEQPIAPNPSYSLVDSEILHAMIRHHKPNKIVEIGSGWSTQVAARSCVMNESGGNECELLTIDPNPSKTIKQGFPGLSAVIEKRVEAVPLSDIVDCDLLFIDSSHVVKIGGDVNYEILEIVPRLKAGALVHWHDILLPGEYWEEWVKGEHYFFTEQYMLHAFMKYNQTFEVLWASRYMQLKYSKGIKAVFPNFEPERHHLMSFWVRRKD